MRCNNAPHSAGKEITDGKKILEAMHSRKKCKIMQAMERFSRDIFNNEKNVPLSKEIPLCHIRLHLKECM
jgi:hypothetical protein